MQTHTIKPLFNQFLFRRVDLGTTTDIIIPDGATGTVPAALVLDIGPDCKAVAIGDLVILAEGVGFSGYPGPDETKPDANGVLVTASMLVHLINEQCAVAKYIPVAPEAGITMLN